MKAVAAVALIAIQFVPGINVAADAFLATNLGLGFGAATAITSIAGAVGIAAGLSVLAGLVAPGLPSINSAGAGLLNNYSAPINNLPIVYGRARVGGPAVFYHANSGATETRYYVIELAGHECDAIEEIWLNDEAVTLSGNLVTSGKYANKCWVWPQTGTSSDAPPSEFTSETGGRWTSAHQGKGIAKLYVKFELSDDVIANGRPVMTAVVRGKNDIYDPRDGSTGYTDNAILCLYNYHALARVDGGFGGKMPTDMWDFVATQANICDESVSLAAGGAEPRYTVNGVIDTGAGPDTIRDELLLACAGTRVKSGNRTYFYAGAWRPVSATLHEDDVASDVQYKPLAGGKYTNEVRGSFVSETEKWQPVEYPVQSASDTEQPETLQVDLRFTKSGSMAQRIAKILMNRARAQKRMSWPMNIKGLAIQAADTVAISPTLYPFLSNQSFMVSGWSLSDDGNQIIVSLDLTEESPDWYDWSATEEPPVKVSSQTLADINAASVGAGTSPTLTAGTPTSSTVPLVYTQPAGIAVGRALIYQNTINDLDTATLIYDQTAAPSATVNYTATGLTTATTYYFWGRAFNSAQGSITSASQTSATTA